MTAPARIALTRDLDTAVASVRTGGAVRLLHLRDGDGPCSCAAGAGCPSRDPHPAFEVEITDELTLRAYLGAFGSGGFRGAFQIAANSPEAEPPLPDQPLDEIAEAEPPEPSAPAASLPGLTVAHLADLRRSGLSDATITAAGIRSLSAAEVLAFLTRSSPVGDGYAIPYPDLTHADGSPYGRVRLTVPLPDRTKYLARAGEHPRLYVPPGLPDSWRENAKLRLLLTEGEKKALKATQEDFPCLGLGGVWGWRWRQGRDSVPLPDFHHIAWRGRSVVVVGDSDLRANEQAGDGLRELVAYLKSLGARAALLLLPSPEVPRG